MNRRDFLAGAATGVVAGAAGLYEATRADRRPVLPTPPQEAVPAPAIPTPESPAPESPAIAKNIRELKMVTTWPKNFPGFGAGAQRVADRVSALTDGKLRVQVFAGGELVPALESFDAVSNGTADMYHGAEYYWENKSPAFNFFTTVPAGLTAVELNAWIRYGGGQKLWDDLSGRFNIKPMLCGNTGVQMGGWFTKEIKGVADLSGLKLRMPGLRGEVMRRLGATVLSLPAQEIYPALQAGKIDGTEWVGPWNDLAFGFYKIAKNYYWPGLIESGAAVSLGINRTVWDELQHDQQYVLLHAAAAENDCMYAEFTARNAEALATLVNEHGVQLRRFPDDMLKAIGAAAVEVVSEIGNADQITKRTYESYAAFRQRIGRWTALSEEAFTKARSAFLPA